MAKQQRDQFRIVFPSDDRPRIRFRGNEFDVVDLSQSGLRFVHSSDQTFAPGYRVDGTIVFSDGEDEETVAVRGSVLRTDVVGDEKQSVIILGRGLPQQQIIRVQQRLIRREATGRDTR